MADAPEFATGWNVEDGGGADTPSDATPPKPDLRTREGREAAGLPPKENPNKGMPRGTRSAAPAPKARTATPTTRTKVDYRPGIVGLGQLAAFGVSFTSPMDADAILAHTPNIAEALNQLAGQDPKVARVLDKILSAGPYGAVIAATFPLIVQILANHNAVPAALAAAMGIQPAQVPE